MKEYRLLARFYDIVLGPFLYKLRRQILGLVKRINPESIIDICCGTGNQLKLLKKAGFDNLTCVDLSRDMLRVAERGKYSPGCLLKDAAATGLPSESFDLAITSLALHEKGPSTARQILSEIHRILKPGAPLIVSDYCIAEAAHFFPKAVIHCIEFLAGGEHFRNYQGYVAAGGLPSLRRESGFIVAEKKRILMGSMSLEVWYKPLPEGGSSDSGNRVDQSGPAGVS